MRVHHRPLREGLTVRRCRCHNLWCWLDNLLACRYRYVCDRHDRYITGPSPDANDLAIIVASRTGMPQTPDPVEVWTDDTRD